MQLRNEATRQKIDELIITPVLMQTLATFFGLEAEVKSVLDPEHWAYVAKRIKATALLSHHNFESVAIYLHSLVLRETTGSFFGRAVPISNRLSSIEIEFKVNEKQRQKGAIQFYNFAFDDTIDDGTVAGVSPFLVRRTINSQKIHHGQAYQTELITCIEKRVRDDHRKIKGLPGKEWEKMWI